MRTYVPEGVYVMPEWSGVLRNHYWFIRWLGGRNPSRRRALYRKIHKEKLHLAASGVDREHVRLVCLLLADPRRECRTARCIAFEAALFAVAEAKRGTNAVLAPILP